MWQDDTTSTASNTRENSSILKMTNVCTSMWQDVTRPWQMTKTRRVLSPPCHKFVTRWMNVFSTCEWLWKKTNFSRNDVVFWVEIMTRTCAINVIRIIQIYFFEMLNYLFCVFCLSLFSESSKLSFWESNS